MTYIGIRHVHMLVSDQERAVSFYTKAFAMTEVLRAGSLAILGTPGGGDSLSLHLADSDSDRDRVGQHGGFEHFGVHMTRGDSIDDAVVRGQEAGGRLVERGEHAPGIPYAFVADPDGYTIEISRAFGS